MSILDPAEKKQVEELLDSSQAVAAGQILLQSKNLQHKALRPLVTRCVGELVELGRHAFDKGELSTAAEHIQVAQKLRPLSGPDAEFAAKLQATLTQRKAQDAADQKNLADLRQLADDGHLRTVIERKREVQHLPEGRQLIMRMEGDLVAYQRYVEECRRWVDAGDGSTAEVIWKRAAAVDQHGTELVELKRKIADLRGGEGEKPTANEVLRRDHVVRREDGGLILDFGDPAVNSLVLFGNTLVLGSTKVQGTPADICLASTQLHQQHAVLYRHMVWDNDLGDHQMRYWLSPHPSYGENCIAVESQSKGRQILETRKKLGCIELEDGDRIELMGRMEGVVALAFHRRTMPLVSESKQSLIAKRHTASLEMIPDASDSVEDTSAMIECNRISCRYVALLFDDLTIGQSVKAEDLGIPAMPAGTIGFRFVQDKLMINSSGVQILSDGTDGQEYDDGFVRAGMYVKVRASRASSGPRQFVSPDRVAARVCIRPLVD